MFYKDRSIYCFYIKATSRPGLAKDILSVFSNRGINILYISTSVAELGEEGIMIGFFDLTGHSVSMGQLLKELRGIKDVKAATIIPPKFTGFIADTVSFPLMLSNVRALLLDEPALKGLLVDVRERMGTGGEAMLYHFGFQLGLEGADYILREAENIGAVEPLEKLSIAADIFKANGYGVIEEITAFREKPPYLELKISGCIECSLAEGKADKPFSHFIRGIIAGFSTRLFNREMFAEETRCIAKGDPHCKFIIKPKINTQPTKEHTPEEKNQQEEILTTFPSLPRSTIRNFTLYRRHPNRTLN